MFKNLFIARFCSKKNESFPILTRDFIYDRLYHRESGYFTNQQQVQLGQLKKIINFQNLIGYEEYMKQLEDNYPENAWLTPSEIFRPYYGITIGNYIHQQFNFIRSRNNKIKKLRIIEAGAGFGAACEGALTFFKQFSPFVLKNMEYHIVELSSLACTQAEKRLIESGFGDLIKKGNIRILNQDMMNYVPKQNEEEAWFLLFLEVFDNLPQDRLYGDIKNGLVKETWVNRSEQGKLFEEQKDLNDPLIREVVNFYKEFLSQSETWVEVEKDQQISFLRKLIKKYYGKEKDENIFLPTSSLGIFKHIQKQFYGTKSIIVADFDMLNNEYTPQGIGAPIVSKKLRKPHEKRDYQTYLVERGEADIFFPTNFQFMRFLHKKIFNKSAKVMPAYEFVQTFAQQQWTTTKSGYNPLKEDFANTKFLLSDYES